MAQMLAVSDLHIEGPDDPLYAALLRLIRERAQPGDTLVLGGDVFDLLLGNKAIFTDRYRDFLAAIRDACARGVRVHYIEGNHDFQLGGFFPSQVRVHRAWFEERIGDRRFYFAHGDLVDAKDYGYRALRLFLRSPIIKSLIVALPGKLVDRIGTGSSERSRANRPTLPARREGQLEKLRCVFRSFAAERIAEGYDFVVMGHCHDLDEMSFIVDGRGGHYINIGYPRAHGSYVSWVPGDDRPRREALP